MVKETTIKISKEFKETLRGEKLEGEDFEQTITRLINSVSIPKKQEKDGIPLIKNAEYTEEEQEWEEMLIEVSDPNSINGKRIVMKKYKELGVHATIKTLSPIKIIRTIPRDPIKLLEHQKSFL